MDAGWLSDESFRSLHLYNDLSALQSLEMKRYSFGPAETPAVYPLDLYPVSSRELLFLVHRPVCYATEVGFFQLAKGHGLRQSSTNDGTGNVTVSPLSLFRDEQVSEDEGMSVEGTRRISWMRGSTFIVAMDGLHAPHFFWELHAMFSLAQFQASWPIIDRVLLASSKGRTHFTASDSKQWVILPGVKGSKFSFLEEMLLFAIPQTVANIDVLTEQDELVCFEQLVGADNNHNIMTPKK